MFLKSFFLSFTRINLNHFSLNKNQVKYSGQVFAATRMNRSRFVVVCSLLEVFPLFHFPLGGIFEKYWRLASLQSSTSGPRIDPKSAAIAKSKGAVFWRQNFSLKSFWTKIMRMLECHKRPNLNEVEREVARLYSNPSPKDNKACAAPQCLNCPLNMQPKVFQLNLN